MIVAMLIIPDFTLISVTMETPLCIHAKMCATNGGATARSLDNRGYHRGIMQRRCYGATSILNCVTIHSPKSSLKTTINTTHGIVRKAQPFNIIIGDNCFKTYSDGYYCMSQIGHAHNG